jgi:hypothetical protein
MIRPVPFFINFTVAFVVSIVTVWYFSRPAPLRLTEPSSAVCHDIAFDWMPSEGLRCPRDDQRLEVPEHSPNNIVVCRCTSHLVDGH